MLSVLPAPSLAERTTLRIGGTALAEVVLTEDEDVFRLEEVCARLGGAPYILGAGSNILAQDGELPLVLVRPHFQQQPVVVEKDADGALVRAGAGVRLPRLLGQCAAWGRYSGYSRRGRGHERRIVRLRNSAISAFDPYIFPGDRDSGH